MFLLILLLLATTLIYHLSGFKISKKCLFGLFIVDLLIVLLIQLKWIYFFTPLFGEPEWAYMSLSNSWEAIYCGCILLFPWYMSLLYLVLLLILTSLKFFCISHRYELSKLTKYFVIIWTILLIFLSFLMSSVYGNYKPYGLYKDKNNGIFDKDRNIIIDIVRHYSQK